MIDTGMIQSIAIGFVLAFLAVFLKTFQQQNIMYNRTALIMPTSFGLTYSDLFLTVIFVKVVDISSISGGLIIGAFIAIANGVACRFSMKIHYWVVKKIYKSEDKE